MRNLIPLAMAVLLGSTPAWSSDAAQHFETLKAALEKEGLACKSPNKFRDKMIFLRSGGYQDKKVMKELVSAVEKDHRRSAIVDEAVALLLASALPEKELDKLSNLIPTHCKAFDAFLQVQRAFESAPQHYSKELKDRLARVGDSLISEAIRARHPHLLEALMATSAAHLLADYGFYEKFQAPNLKKFANEAERKRAGFQKDYFEFEKPFTRKQWVAELGLAREILNGLKDELKE